MGRSKTSDFQGTPYFSRQGYRFNYGQEQRSYAKVYRLKGRLEFKRAQNAIQRAFDSEWKETKQKVKISLRLLLCDGQSLR